MASTSGEGHGVTESDKGSEDETFGENESKEDVLLQSCDSRVINNELILIEPSMEELNGENLEPYTGMSFDSIDDTRDFYNEYAKRTGFSIRTNRIRHSQKNRAVIARDYVCSREGFRAAKHTLRKDRILPPRPITREGCKAMIRVAVRDGGKWIVTKFVREHNHKLMTHSKVPGERSIINILSEEEKDKKIHDLSIELQRERERSAAFQEQLHMVLKDLEEHAEFISIRVEDIVKNMREIEFEGQEISTHR
ncbi:hypothetical protein HHK36_022055 [Tetracentron sinense]|uniref:FAR1 domain-containing protein n=1 Tax=Tetracentron sinense TaxID=13715 RepID=A0A834YUE6_TETSI|nr:hypothetical protein HHK36_022055 [Tetracentron sinense]